MASSTVPGAAWAADPPPPAEPIVVTGSRLEGPDRTAISPVTSLGARAITLDQAVNIEDSLNTLPQFIGSFGAVSNGADSRGAATADLRGLGQNRTLVLIDGTRAAPFGFRNSVDLNAIPVALLARVDVLTGGAAAVYGSDAVAGVVNFITARHFTGVEGRAISTFTDRGESLSKSASLTVGRDIGARGNVAAYLSYSQREPLFKYDRAFASPELTANGVSTARPIGGYFRRSDGAAVFDLSGIGGSATATTFGFDDSGALLPGQTSSILTGDETLVMAQRRLNAGLFWHVDLAPGVEFYGRGMFAWTRSRDVLPPVSAATSVLVQRDNPFLTPELSAILGGSFNRTSSGNLGGADATLLAVNRSYAELGDRVTVTTRRTAQGQAGLRGDMRGVRWNGYVQYGLSDEDSPILGEGIVARLQQAANALPGPGGQPVCADPSNGCVAADIFGPNAISPAAASFIGQTVDQGRRREQRVAGFTLSGDLVSLPAGAVQGLGGVEYRKEHGTITYGQAAQLGQTFNQGTKANFSGGYDVKDVFEEVRAPLFADRSFAQALNVEVAYRHSDYSTSRGVDAWKLGGDWAPLSGLRFRGSYQRFVRAPNIGELYGATSSLSLAGRANDPCANPAASGASVEVCTASGAPAGGFVQDLTNALFIFGGRSTIRPETGKTWTLGAVVAPPSVPNLHLSADYYDIRIDNAVGAVLPQATLDTCFVIVRDIDNIFCHQVKRQPNGQLASVDSSDINVARLQSRGIDVDADWSRYLGTMRLGLSYAGSLILSQKQQNGEASPIVECAGKFGGTCGLEVRRALPRYRHRTDASLQRGPVTVRATWRLEGAVDDDAPATVYPVEHIEPQHYLDLAIAVDVDRRATFIVGVDNLFDRQPPLAFGNAADANTFPQSYDVIGRRFGVSFIARR